MLEIEVVTAESYDEVNEKFVKSETVRLQLEHSLVSLSKWEAIHEKAFLSDRQRTDEETISYVKCMIVGPEPSSEVFYKLLSDHIETVMAYVAASMSGTRLPESKNAQGRRETITSEKIYYWMTKLNVDMACEHWHLNKLFTYLRMHALLESPKKKMTMEERRALNEQRKKEWNTTG